MVRKQSKSRLAMVVKRRRWRSGDASVVLSAWQSSGESMSAFTRRYGLDPWRLKYWRRRLAEDEAIELHPVKLIAGSVRGEASAGSAGVELVLRGGRRVVVQRGFDAELLEELVRAAESWPC